ncbi:CHAD domain-containing protein [bacterium]|nr:CHAD domain-containing protein [candidate division CSSED10-310 bacterium]
MVEIKSGDNRVIIQGNKPKRSIEAVLQPQFKMLHKPQEEYAYSYYDTFDWRLAAGKRVLRLNGRFLEMCDYLNESVLIRVEWPRKTVPRFHWEFSNDGMRENLRCIAGTRALVKIADMHQVSETVIILNHDDATVGTLRHDQISVSDPGGKSGHRRLTRLFLKEGYETEADFFIKLLNSEHYEVLPDDPPNLELYMQVIERTPFDYSSKLDVNLEPAMTSDQAIAVILRRILHIIHANLQGIIDDIDSEFLHDMRVASRRGRAAITQLNTSISEKPTTDLTSFLRRIGKQTNHLRDLDVYMSKRCLYMNMLPEKLHSGLNQLFEDLSGRRKSALKSVKRFVTSRSFQNELSRWNEFFDGSDADNYAGNSGKPLSNSVKPIIFRRYRKVFKIGRAIRADSPSSHLHKLRLQCKKLRYLLELFESLFPKDTIKFLVKKLKNLQDVLGDFNDLSVQQRFLSEYLAAVKDSDPNSTITAAALGGLITHLWQEQHRVRSKFTDVFKSFVDKDVTDLFKTLFTTE